MTPGDILANYVNVGHQLAVLTQPYALHLLYLLSIIECATIGLTYMMDAEAPGELFGRGLRLVFVTGFAYWWIENGWTLATIVLGSFDQLGKSLSGIPELTPVAFIKTASAMAETIYQAPITTHLLPDLGLAFAETSLVIVIFITMLLIAAVVIFTLAAAWLIIGPGMILVPLLVTRFTSHMAEGYFTWLLRTAVMILFFYVVLGTAQHFATGWNASITAACAADAKGVCTHPIQSAALVSLLGSAVVLAFICIGVPFTAAHIVSGGVSMALEHLAAAKYLAGGAAGKVAGAVTGLSRQISKAVHSNSQRSTLEQRMAAGAAAAAKNPPPSQATTQPLPKQTPVNAFGVPRTKGLPGNNGTKPTTRI